MARKPRLEEEVSDVNIMPLMNIIMLLIPFLIMSTEFIKLGVINVAAPRLDGAPIQRNVMDEPKGKPLNLTVQLSKGGMKVFTSGKAISAGCKPGKKNEPSSKKELTIPVLANAVQDFKALKSCLVKIKRQNLDEQRMIIMSDPEIPYHVIIKTMDASRHSPALNNLTKKKSHNLFPLVVVSAGYI